MCGIVGYSGSRPALGIVIDGLRRMEYRGYDSAGVAFPLLGAPGAPGSLVIAKKAGKLAELEKELAEHPLPLATTGIGHTRWATHGGPTDRNAHPHLGGRGVGGRGGELAVIHNGIIENFAVLRAELVAEGYVFASDTDTECAAHLLARAYDALPADTGHRLAEAMRDTCRRLHGAFTLLVVHADHPHLVVGARRDSPLVAGRGDGENFLASDVTAFIEHTRDAVELGQDQVVEITPDSLLITDFQGSPATGRDFRVDWDAAAAEKGGFTYFMDKEIAEQPEAVAATLLGRTDETGRLVLDELRISESELREIDKVFVVACGTAYHAGLTARYAIEHWTRLPVDVELASEFRYRDPVLDSRTLVVSISQSGETMDTLMAVRHAREQGARTVSICNTNGSTIPRESDAVLYTHAGPEVAVASTKTFLAQLVACYLLGLYLAQVRGTKYDDEVADTVTWLAQVPDQLRTLLAGLGPVRELGRELSTARAVLFLGRHVGYPVALEGALKLKELAYMHAEAFAAGELKHGPIALIEQGTPVVVVVPGPHGRLGLHAKIVSNIQEVRARGARTIVVAEEGDEDVVPYADHIIRVPALPHLLSPLVSTVPLQVLAREIAAARGNDIDQPRNLAKSVTVE
jgi:glucosamine--fructose-6-phosphate aminotransferase (isomerizing)